MSVQCPAKCGKKFVSVEFAEKHADEAHEDWRIPKSKGWRTPYGFGDWAYPITYEQACKEMKEMSDKFWGEKHANHESA